MTMLDVMQKFMDKKKMRRKGWEEGVYVVLEKNGFVRSDGERIFPVFDCGDNWEEYTNWNDPRNWVNHLCFFWNDGDDGNMKIGLLRVYDERKTEKTRFFCMGNWFQYCRPVKTEEVVKYLIPRGATDDK